MKHLSERALPLIETAVRDIGRVSLEPPKTVVVDIPGGPTLKLELAPFHEGRAPGAGSGKNLWVLRRPKASLLRDLRAAGQSFVTLDGKVRIQAPGILVDRTDVAAPGLRAIREHTRRSAFADRASLIPRWLFQNRSDSEWTVTSLAKAVGVSPSVASYALKDLDRRGLVEIRAEGRSRRARLISHEQLVLTWVHEYDWQDNATFPVQAPMGSPQRFVRRLEALGLPRHALSLHAGAAEFWPHTPVEKVAVYVDLRSSADVLQVARDLEWTPDPAGQLILMLPHYRQTLWQSVRESRHAVPVVSNLQLILDLWNHPLRGREQAEVVLEKHVMELERL